MPLAGARNRGGGGGPVLASELAGGEREVGERLEEIESYSKVVLDGVGDDGGGEGVLQLRRGWGGKGRAWELRGGEWKLAVCSVWVEER